MSGEHEHPEYAMEVDLQSLQADVAGRATQADLDALAARVAALEAGQPVPPPEPPPPEPEPTDVFRADLVDGSNVKVTTNDSWWTDWSQVPRGVDQVWGPYIQPEVDRSLSQGSNPRYRAEIDLPDGVVPYHADGSRMHNFTNDTYWAGFAVRLGVSGNPYIEDLDQYAESVTQIHYQNTGTPPLLLSVGNSTNGPGPQWRIRINGSTYWVQPWISEQWLKVVIAIRFGDRLRIWMDDTLVHDNPTAGTSENAYWKLGIYKPGNRQGWVADNAEHRVARFAQWRLAKGADRYADVVPR